MYRILHVHTKTTGKEDNLFASHCIYVEIVIPFTIFYKVNYFNPTRDPLDLLPPRFEALDCLIRTWQQFTSSARLVFFSKRNLVAPCKQYGDRFFNFRKFTGSV